MQTKFYFLLGLLVGFTSFSSSLFAQTACFGYDSGADAPAGFQLSVETFASFDGTESSPSVAALAGSNTYRIYLETSSSMDFVSAVYSDGASGEVQVTTSTSFYMNEFGGLTVNDINPGLFSFFPALEYDSYVTIGLDSEAESGESSIALSGQSSWGPSFLAGNDLSIDASNSAAGSGWSVPDGASNGYAGDDERVMLVQVTTDGDLNGTLFVEIHPGGNAANAFSHQFSFSSEACGCTDASASNYQPGATLDDGSCVFPGCTDSTACNYDSGANEENGSCDYCCDDVTSSNADYGVEVELHANGGITGLKTFRVYVTTANPSDFVSAITGYSAFPMNVSTTTEFWQYLGPGGGVTPNAWQSVLGTFPEFADGAYDSYVTIGNTQAADAGAGESEISTVQTPYELWTSAFEAGGNIEINSVSGGGWFLPTPTAINGIAGDDNRVLIGQFTTSGYLSGDFYLQIFPEGDQANELQMYISWTSPLCACTDESACNYDPAAIWDDGSCQDGPAYWGENIDCEGNCLNDSDGDYVCDEDEIEGCLNPDACNYVPLGTVTDLVPCQFPEENLDCDGNCVNDVDGDGVCDEYETEACTDASACNYNSDPTVDTDNALCVYPDPFEDCSGTCFNDADGDGVCDELEVAGCDDAMACNYSDTATDNDGSCDYCCNSAASVEGYNVVIETVSESPEGSVQRMYIQVPNATDVLSAVTGDNINPTYIRSTQSFYQSPLVSGVTPNGINPAFFPVFPELTYDSWVTIGIENSLYGPLESEIQLVPATTDWMVNFNAGGDIEMDGQFGDGWYVLYGPINIQNPDLGYQYLNGVAGDDNLILVGQFTTNGILSGELFVQMFPEGDSTSPVQVHLPFGYASEDTEAPEFTYVPADMTQSCADAWPTEMATAVDGGCIADVTLTVEESVADADCGYLLTRTFTATDAWGNQASAVQLVNLTDDEAPVAVAQEDLVVQCADDLTPGAGVAEYPTGSYDNCADASDLTFEYVDTPVAAGFDLTGVTADFHVEMGKDFGGPFGQSLILEANGVTIGDGAEITYEDLTSNPSEHRGAIAVDIDGSSINMWVEGTSGFPYAYDYAIVTISNMSTDEIANVTVVSNGIAPGTTLEVSNTNNSITVTWDNTASYTEGESASFAVDNASTCLAQGGFIRTWTVTDGCNNSDTATQNFTIIDTEGPTFTSAPANLELSCNDEIPMGSVEAVDCGDVTISGPVDAEVAGSCGSNYTIMRTWTAEDGCGNVSEHTQVIMIVDNEAPVFTSFPEDMTYTYGDDVEVIEPTATDDCNELTISFSDAQDNSDIEITIITRTWTATDACGNSVSGDQIITVNEVLGCMDELACNYNAGASYDDGSCDYCSCGSGGEAGFGLELELVANHDGSASPELAGMSTYRVYVTTPSSEDFVSSVSGSEEVPAYLRTTTSFFQSPFGGISPGSINPLWFVVVPSLEYDSWLTIGIDQQYNSANNESDISFVQAPSDTWMNEFNAGNNVEINSFFGGSWFALITASNGYAGEDNRVLVAQLTTSGVVTGQLFVQVFPNGDQSQDTYLTLSFGGNECGCMDSTACNYDEDAVYDDGACSYPETGYDCDGVCTSDVDGDGICDDNEIYGCTTEGNCNYDPLATEHDQSMCSVSPFCIGCNDEAACNFNPNVIPEPNFNDGSCEYPEEGFDCDGNCYDENADLICDILQGCGDPTACNYEEGVEFPSYDFCDFCSCPLVTSSHEGYGIEIESVESNVEGATTYQVYITTASSADEVNAILGNALNPIVLASSSEIFQDPAGSALPSPSAMFGFYPLLASDSYVTIGDNTAAENIDFPPVTGGGNPAWVDAFEDGGNIIINDAVGSGWYLSADVMGAGFGLAGDDNRVLVGQITTPGTIHGQLFAQIFPEGLSAGNTLYVTLSFGSSHCGCTDEAACNYDEENYTDDGSCFYAEEGESCESTCLYDSELPVVQSVEDYTTTCELAADDIREPIVTDNCDDILDLTFTDVVTEGDCAGSYSIARTWTIFDNNGNSITAVQNIEVVDQTAPTFTVPAMVNVACTEDYEDLELTGEVTDGADACSEFVSVSYSDSFGENNCFDGDVIIRTWTVTDDCGNSASQDQVINLVDDNAPYFTSVPDDVELECGDALPMDLATAEDACSSVTVTFEDMEGDQNCTGMVIIYRTFTATDGCGNTGYATQTITRIDNEAPMASVADATISCSDYDADAEYGSYEVSDNCMSDISVTWSEVSSTQEGTNGCFEVEREYVFTDGCGNATTLSQLLTVVDDVAPVMDAVDSDVTMECGDGYPAVPGATDNCSDVEVTYSDVDNGMSCSGEMNIIRTYTATDACGNSISVSQNITFVDSTAPTFTTPADATVECDTDLADLGLTGDVLDVDDICSVDIFVTYSDEFSTSEGSCLANNIVTRTWTVTDGCGNMSSDTQTITLVDTTAPVVTYDAQVTLYNEATSALDDFEGVEVYEACGSYTYTTTDEFLGSSVGGYELHRIMVFTDDCGNTTSIEQNITAIYTTGCTYMDAVNYDAAAVIDDGSCMYPGCTDSASANYNPIASVDDGSCVTVGCMDPDGYDYDPNANYPGGCDYPDPCPGDINDDGLVNVGDLLEFFQYYGQDCSE